MFRSLLSACSIAVLVLPTLVVSSKTRSRCPVKAPETLLSLYHYSDAIYVARYDKVEDVDIIEDTADQTVLNVRKHFDVSSTLKGEPRKLFVLDEREYRYKVDQSQPSDEEQVEENEDEADSLYRRPNLEPGDTVLLFLKMYPQENGPATLGLTDYRDAIKKLAGERLDAYQARIRELNSIYDGKKKGNDAAILDWLVRTTQDPLTRWEGAYELQQSYERMQWQESQKEETELEGNEGEDAQATEEQADTDLIVKIKEKGRQQISFYGGIAQITAATDEAAPADETESDETAGENEEDAAAEELDTTVFARLLTDAQKETLTNVLIASASEQSANASAKQKPMSEGDKVLIELVSNWGDNRLAKFLLQQMQAAGQDPYVVYRLMTTTIRVLPDEELERISEEYSEVYYEDGDAFVDQDDTEEEAVNNDSDEDETAAVVEESSDDTETTATDEDTVVEESGDAAEQAHRVTYGELRAELVWKFVARSATVIANAETKETAKAEH